MRGPVVVGERGFENSGKESGERKKQDWCLRRCGTSGGPGLHRARERREKTKRMVVGENKKNGCGRQMRKGKNDERQAEGHTAATLLPAPPNPLWKHCGNTAGTLRKHCENPVETLQEHRRNTAETLRENSTEKLRKHCRNTAQALAHSWATTPL